jgi:signal transduction histidine kinase
MEATIIQEGAIINLQSLPSLKGDQAQLRQLFQNLVGNALKYHKKGESPLVDITCEQVSGKNFENYLPIERREGNYFLIEVKDNGIGFEQEYAEQIFTLFQRLHGKAEYEGSGIGLSIVQKVVENHKGIVWAESLPDEGAVFKVLLPKE